MLDATKNNIQDILMKLQILESCLNGMTSTHIQDKDEVEARLKRISKRKLVLIDEVLRITGVPEEGK